jgi:hypothetical protein
VITARVASSNLPLTLVSKPRAGEATLHVAALAAVEAELVFRGLFGFLGERQGIDAGGQVAGHRRRAVLQ